jgi:hypothetical protein
VLWPFFSKTTGVEESGYKFWPLYGESHKRGVYSKKFFLWPIFFTESTGLDGDNPTELRAVWPFYVSNDSPESSSRTVLWPFFSRTENYVKGYQVWNAPWPFVRVTTGEKYHGFKILPFYADETMDVQRHRWYLWPLYKIEEMDTELIERRRDRVLFFLYSDLKERKLETGESMHRVDFWPVFTYKRTNGVSHLHILSLMEPFFPSNQPIERLWSPLWRVYQQKWDQHGNHVVSLLWNLYWLEKQGDKVAWELFPLLEYHRESLNEVDVSFLKGLVSYQKGESGKSLKLFYLPWGIRWGEVVAESM